MKAAGEYLMADYINGLTDAERSRYTEILWKYIDSIKSEGYRYLVSSIYKDIPELDQLPASLKNTIISAAVFWSIRQASRVLQIICCIR